MGILISKKSDGYSSTLLEKASEQEAKPTRYYSKNQEDAVAKAVGGERNINSGATMFIKGDCINDKWLIECKTKTKHCESMSIKKEWIEKNKKEALFMGKPFNAIAFNFGPNEQNYYIIDQCLFQELMSKI